MLKRKVVKISGLFSSNKKVYYVFGSSLQSFADPLRYCSLRKVSALSQMILKKSFSPWEIRTIWETDGRGDVSVSLVNERLVLDQGCLGSCIDLDSLERCTKLGSLEPCIGFGRVEFSKLLDSLKSDKHLYPWSFKDVPAISAGSFWRRGRCRATLWDRCFVKSLRKVILHLQADNSRSLELLPTSASSNDKHYEPGILYIYTVYIHFADWVSLFDTTVQSPQDNFNLGQFWAIL